MINNKENNKENDDLNFIPLNIRNPFNENNSTWVPLLDSNFLNANDFNNNFIFGFGNSIDNSNLEVRSLKTLDYVEKNRQETKQQFDEDFNLEYPSETYNEALFSYDKKCKGLNNNTNINKNITSNNPNINESYYTPNNNYNNNSMINNNMNNIPNNNMNNIPNNDMNNIPNNNMSNIPNNNMNNIPNNSMSNIPNNMNNISNNNMNNTPNNNMNNMLNNEYYNQNNNLNNDIGGNFYNSSNNKNINANSANKTLKEDGNETKLTYIKDGCYEELIHMKLLRNIDFNNSFEDKFRGKGDLSEKVDRIFNSIKNEESIMETFKVYSVPKPICDLIIKKIIKIALENYECK